MDPTTLYGGATVAALLATCWQQVRVLASKIVSLVFVRVKVHHPLSRHIATYCYSHFRRSPFGLLTFDSAHWFVRPRKRYQHVGFEKPGREPLIFWNGFRPVLLSAMPSNQTNGVSEGDTCTITVLRWQIDAEALLLAAIEEHNARTSGEMQEGRFRVMRMSGSGHYPQEASNRTSPMPVSPGEECNPQDFRLLKWTADDVGPEKSTGNALDYLAFPPSVSVLVTELRHWLSSEEWYRQRGIPWRRGWLLYGRPGTGKTSLVRAIAQDLDLPVCAFDLATMSNREMVSNWRDALSFAPCIVLIEDIDSVFEGRKNVTGEDGGGLSFDCLLNCLSGIESANGVFLVITTNRVELLDEALGAPRAGSNGTMISTRPGRVDRALELKGMDEKCRRILAERILADCPQETERLIKDGEDDTAAQFQERCAQVALADHWRQTPHPREVAG